MANTVVGDVTVLNDDDIIPGFGGANEPGVVLDKLKETYKPEFRTEGHGPQGTKIRWTVGPTELDFDGSGAFLGRTSPTGVAAATFVDAYIFTIVFQMLGGMVPGGNYFSELSLDYTAEGAKAAELNFKGTNNTGIP